MERGNVRCAKFGTSQHTEVVSAQNEHLPKQRTAEIMVSPACEGPSEAIRGGQGGIIGLRASELRQIGLYLAMLAGSMGLDV